MVKWSDLVHRMLTFDDSTVAKRAAKKLARMPAFMSILEANYRASYLKRHVKAKLAGVLESIDKGDMEMVDSPDPLAVHVIKVLRPYANASDALVARWGRICEELSDSPEVMLLLTSLQVGDTSVIDAFHASMNWTLSECNRRKCFTLPFSAVP